MNKVEKLILIEGDFSQDDAKEILSNIFSSKIHFHNLKNWSSKERFGKENEIAQKRIPALKKEMEKLQAIFSEANTINKKVFLSSVVNITTMDE